MVQERINLTVEKELQELLEEYWKAFNKKEYKSKAAHYISYLPELYSRLHPYLANKRVEEKIGAWQFYQFHEDKPIPIRFYKPLAALASVLDIQLIRISRILENNIRPVKTFIVVGNPTAYKVFAILYTIITESTQNYITLNSKKIKKYGHYWRYYKFKSITGKVPSKKLNSVKITNRVKENQNIKFSIAICKLVKLRFEYDALYFKSKRFLDYRKKCNTKSMEIIGPRWRDRKGETKSAKYYFGIKHEFKIYNKWLKEKNLNICKTSILELKRELKKLPLIKVPSNLPQKPKTWYKPSNKPKGWHPKLLLLEKKNMYGW
jgi:hypothetical protein